MQMTNKTHTAVNLAVLLFIGAVFFIYAQFLVLILLPALVLAAQQYLWEGYTPKQVELVHNGSLTVFYGSLLFWVELPAPVVLFSLLGMVAHGTLTYLWNKQ